MDHKEANETVGSAFTQFRRKNLSEMRPYIEGEDTAEVSISPEDLKAGSPKPGDMIARNPKNHKDQWLVAKKYFENNLEPLFEADSEPESERKNNLPFGLAIEALKQGKRVQRAGWNGKGLFIFMQVPSSVDNSIVPRMTSLPQSVKNEFDQRLNNAKEHCSKYNVDPLEVNSIRYQNQIAMVYPDNNIYGWVASPSDVLENDWIILD